MLAELTACRTPALGSYSYACEHCQATFFGGYNSCRNRYCPTCGGPTRGRWLERVRQDILPVDYFHFVFTLPDSISSLAWANQKLVYDLLFHSAWQTLSQLAADPRRLGGQLGALMVLHTWNQLMREHAHVHCVIPGGALSPQGAWIPARRSKKTGKPYLLCVQAVSRLFRGKFLAGLKQLHASGKLNMPASLSHLTDKQAWEQFLTPLYQKEWVAYGEGPPEGTRGPDAVLKYLARYVAGVAISDRRLISHEGDEVKFWAREPKKPGRSSRKNRRGVQTLSGAEFVRRFLLHILPRGFQRIRYYGLLSNRHRNTKLAQVRLLLGESPQQPLPAEANDPGDSQQEVLAPGSECPNCGKGLLQLVQSVDTPLGWADILLASPFATQSDGSWWEDRLRGHRCRGAPAGKGPRKVA